MNSKPSALTLVLTAAALLLGLALLVFLLPVMIHAAGFAVTLIPFLLTAAGLYSCLVAAKPVNMKLVWIIIILLAPILGPLLWFVWGKQNT